PQVVVQLARDRAAADLVEVVVGLQAGDRLTVAAAVDRDGDVVAVADRPVDVGQLGELVTQPVDLRVDLLGGRLRTGDLDPQVFVAGDRHDRAHLDDGVEADRPLVLARGDLDLRRRDDVDVVLADRLRVVGGQLFAQRLLAADVLAELLLEDPPRRLAGPEPRQPDLAGDPAERGVEILFELRLVHLDGDLDAVPLEGLDDGSHRRVSVPAPLWRPEHGFRSAAVGRPSPLASRPPGSSAARQRTCFGSRRPRVRIPPPRRGAGHHGRRTRWGNKVGEPDAGATTFDAHLRV